MMNKEYQSGFASAALAYILWGVCPIYFAAINKLGSWEILSHRIIWSVILLLPLSILLTGFSRLKSYISNPFILKRIILASVLISANWVTFIYAVNNGQTIEASLGYFLNPIFTVILGFILFKEKLSISQWICLILAGIGLTVQLAATGHVSWISLTLTLTFGFYGVLKKTMKIPAVDGLLFETSFAAPIALGYLVYLQQDGFLVFGQEGIGFDLLISTSGLVTTVPLLLFAWGAKRLPLNTLGFLQYLAPSLQFLVAIFYFGESISKLRLMSFILIWVGLCFLVFGPLVTIRWKKRLASQATNE